MQYRFKYYSIREMIVKVITAFTTVLFFLIYVVSYQHIDKNPAVDYHIFQYILSLLGIVLGIFVFISWHQLTNKFFSLYTIFMLFLFLFNYGHSLMWAFGIHQDDEIGQSTLFTLGMPKSADIVKTQMIVLIGILAFHCGAIFCNKPKSKQKRTLSNTNVLFDDRSLNSIYDVCLMLSFFVIPITFYNSFYNLSVALRFGYSSLYYGDYANSGITPFVLISMMFFPCLVGLLLGSKYNKNVKFIVYFTFAVYVLLGIITGDRGEWIYKLLILVWMSHTFNKKLTFKSIIKYVLLGIGFLYLVSAVVSLRNTGITFDGFIESLSSDNNLLVSTVFEMGLSMRPTMVLVRDGWDIFPYGNTYIFSMLGMVSERLISILDIPYVTLSSWFSQTYLGISYGAGFSIIAEALLNFGPYVAPLFLFLLGYIITSAIYVDTVNFREKPLRVFFAITTASVCISIVRNTMQGTLKSWFYTTLIIYFLVLFYRSIKYNYRK
ncbi:O-antigen polysaccharide polymerase Wzy [Peribacillus butanolivorans]|uniref:O-antigen polysaccharide polymerase Wzy n=1 Tax=Peribacillus butanolivorans TaxID=421767 RepID=UPI00367313E8